MWPAFAWLPPSPRLWRTSRRGSPESFRGWWLGAELNRRHKDFQSSALPTELPSLRRWAHIQLGLCLIGKAEFM